MITWIKNLLEKMFGSKDIAMHVPENYVPEPAVTESSVELNIMRD